MGALSRRKGAAWGRRIVNDLKSREIPAVRSAPMQTFKDNGAGRRPAFHFAVIEYQDFLALVAMRNAQGRAGGSEEVEEA